MCLWMTRRNGGNFQHADGGDGAMLTRCIRNVGMWQGRRLDERSFEDHYSPLFVRCFVGSLCVFEGHQWTMMTAKKENKSGLSASSSSLFAFFIMIRLKSIFVASRSVKNQVVKCEPSVLLNRVPSRPETRCPRQRLWLLTFKQQPSTIAGQRCLRSDDLTYV